MWLKMYIGKIFLAKAEFDFAEMQTEAERQVHIEKLADCLYWDNWNKIKAVGIEPRFFYELESKLNDFVFGEDAFEDMSWADVKMYYSLKSLEDGND